MNENLHAILRELRKRNHLSQEDVANAVHVTRQAVSQWESGKTSPDIKSIKLLCKLYGISSSELLRDEYTEKIIKEDGTKKIVSVKNNRKRCGKMFKKKKIIIVTGVSVAIFFVVGLFFLHHLYYYERSILANSVLVEESMSEQQAETIVLYKYVHFGIVDEETPQLAEGKKIVELTDDQKNTIRSLIDGKNWSPHRRLWYRFDAILMCDNGRRYMLDMENGIIFIEVLGDEPEYLYGVDGDVSDVGWKIRSCIILSGNELNTLKKELKGTGVKHID